MAYLRNVIAYPLAIDVVVVVTIVGISVVIVVGFRPSNLVVVGTLARNRNRDRQVLRSLERIIFDCMWSFTAARFSWNRRV